MIPRDRCGDAQTGTRRMSPRPSTPLRDPPPGRQARELLPSALVRAFLTPVLILVASAVAVACGGQVGAAHDARRGRCDGRYRCLDRMPPDTEAGASANDGGAPYPGAVVSVVDEFEHAPVGGLPLLRQLPHRERGHDLQLRLGHPRPAAIAERGNHRPCSRHPAGRSSRRCRSTTRRARSPSTPQSHASWTPGDPLAVSAPGNPSQVHAFAGTLQRCFSPGSPRPSVPPRRTSSFPSISPSSSRGRPEGRSGETVNVVLSQLSTSSIVNCACLAPDSRGRRSRPRDAAVGALRSVDHDGDGQRVRVPHDRHARGRRQLGRPSRRRRGGWRTSDPPVTIM